MLYEVITLLEVHHVVIAQRPDEPVHELLGGEVADRAARIALADVPGDGVHQVGLAEADAGIEEQRVERRDIGFRDPARRRPGELVGLADDERIEGEAAVERSYNFV